MPIFYRNLVTGVSKSNFFALKTWYLLSSKIIMKLLTGLFFCSPTTTQLCLFSTTYSKFLWIIKSCPSTKKVDFLFLIKTTLTTFYLSQTRRTCFFQASKNPPVRKKNNPDEKQAHSVKSCSLFGLG